MSREQLLLNTHIEKTAGTSLLRYIGTRIFKPEETYVYRPLTNSFNRYDELLKNPQSPFKKQIRKLLIQTSVFPYVRHLLPNNKDIYVHHSIDKVFSLKKAAKHGHFLSNPFDAHMKAPHFTTVVFREPLERMKSHFRYLKTTVGSVNQRSNMYIDPHMTFRDFAFHPLLINWQTQAVAGKRLEDFDLVGVSEKLIVFQKELHKRLAMAHTLAPIATERLNITEFYEEDAFTDAAFERAFKSVHEADYALYAQACSIVEHYEA